VLDTLTDATLHQGSESNFRPLGQIGWHITTTIHEILSSLGLTFTAPEGEEKAPDSAAQIAAAYRNVSQAMLEAIQSQWTDENLSESSLMLRSLISHEIHHLGQMTVLMRQAGLRIPNLYGPTRDHWIEKGLQPHI